MSNGAYPITAGMVYEAVVQGAREATLEALKNVDFSTAEGQGQIKAVLGTIAGKDFATQTTLAAVLEKLADLGTELTLDDVKTAAETLAGTVADGAQKVTLTGQTVTIGGVNYDFDPPRTLYGPAASRPSASDAHAAVPYVVYVSVDTKAIEQTDGTNWQRWGVA